MTPDLIARRRPYSPLKRRSRRGTRYRPNIAGGEQRMRHRAAPPRRRRRVSRARSIRGRVARGLAHGRIAASSHSALAIPRLSVQSVSCSAAPRGLPDRDPDDRERRDYVRRLDSISMGRVLVGFVTGSLAGIVMGVLLGVSGLLHDLLDPIIELLRYFSPTAMIPIAVIWFGIGEMSKYFLIFWGTFFIVLINTIAGVWRTPSRGSAPRNALAPISSNFRSVSLFRPRCRTSSPECAWRWLRPS